MTVWEFACAVEGYARAHSTEEAGTPAMDDKRLADLGIEGF
ncbi:hypothetical protein [Aliihoeflea sp. 40Bstr573]|nr:hypothetical protein [Aliihoeflea sp. 40Bstr573]